MNSFSDDFIKMISESKMAILGTLNTFGILNILYSSIIENYLKHIDLYLYYSKNLKIL